MTRDFVETARKAKPLAVITEATNMTGAAVSSESEVEDKLNMIVEVTDGIVLSEFAFSDVDRLNSFFHIARRNQRCPAVSLKQAHLLDAFRKDKGLSVPALNNKVILIFRKSKKCFDKGEEQIIERYNSQCKILDVFEVSKQQCKVTLVVSFYDFEDLVELQPEAGSCYIISSSEPFNEEMETDYERLSNWLRHCGLAQYHVRVSGHIMPLRLKASLQKISAKRIFPIHTESAGLFATFMRDS
jgi:mRNA degradation ribonuclease J1/J2